MLATRVIPVLLLLNKGLVKTVKFKDPTYVGDPINAVKIFNEKEVDELIFLDIDKEKNSEPDYALIEKIASECFMPVCYGGKIKSIDQIKRIFNLGIEKVAINTNAIENPKLIEESSKLFGAQSIIVSIDVKKTFTGKYKVFISNGTKPTKHNPVELIKEMADIGAGEIVINSIDRDGTFAGYDIELIKMVSNSVQIPIIACGGAGKLTDFTGAIELGGASAVAAGSLFVFYGKHRAVLIN